jgi:hypothetical protein
LFAAVAAVPQVGCWHWRLADGSQDTSSCSKTVARLEGAQDAEKVCLARDGLLCCKYYNCRGLVVGIHGMPAIPQLLAWLLQPDPVFTLDLG